MLDARFADDPSARRGVAAWLRGAIEAASLRDCARDCAAHFAPNGAAAFVARDYRERMGLRALKPANVVKPEAKPDVKPDFKPDIKPAAKPAPTVGELKARLRARGIPEQKISACLEKRELVALLAEAEAPSPPPPPPPAASMAPPAPPAAPPSQASAASQPFVYDLAGSSSDEEDGGAAHAAKRARLSEESSRSLPSSFFCAISHSVMRDPVVCADGMTYERAYIESWLLAHDTSPLTNQPLAHKLLVPNIALKQAIGEMLERV